MTQDASILDDGVRRAAKKANKSAAILVTAAFVAWVAGVGWVLASAYLSEEANGKMAVLFWPPPTAETGFRAIIAAGGEPIRPYFGSTLWIAHGAEPGFVGRLKAEGATAAFKELTFGPAFAGCFAYLSERLQQAACDTALKLRSGLKRFCYSLSL